MSDQPLVSFVVPCYNYGRYLLDCLNSILTLEGDYEIEVIAIDDCSTDNTVEVLNGLTDPRLRVIRHTHNRGHVFTVNEGLKETRGKYVVRTDPDDRYRPNFLTETIPKLEQYPDVGLAYGDVAMIGENGTLYAERCDRVHNGSDFKGNEFIAILKNNFIGAPAVIARREAWMSAWPIPEGLAFNDWYFNIMLARRYEFYYVNKVVAEYRVHTSNHHAKIVQDRSEERSILRLLDKVFAEPETDPTLEQLKRTNRSAVYAAQYLDFGNKYFGFQMNRDARRCYKEAIVRKPSAAIRPEIVRRLAATFFPRDWYDSAKRIVRSRD
jgi:glycosyltransferase involved in cell wall biosynthesis